MVVASAAAAVGSSGQQCSCIVAGLPTGVLQPMIFLSGLPHGYKHPHVVLDPVLPAAGDWVRLVHPHHRCQARGAGVPGVRPTMLLGLLRILLMPLVCTAAAQAVALPSGRLPTVLGCSQRAQQAQLAWLRCRLHHTVPGHHPASCLPLLPAPLRCWSGCGSGATSTRPTTRAGTAWTARSTRMRETWTQVRRVEAGLVCLHGSNRSEQHRNAGP